MELLNDEKSLGQYTIFPDPNPILNFYYVIDLPTAQLQSDTGCFLGITIKFWCKDWSGGSGT